MATHHAVQVLSVSATPFVNPATVEWADQYCSTSVCSVGNALSNSLASNSLTGDVYWAGWCVGTFTAGSLPPLTCGSTVRLKIPPPCASVALSNEAVSPYSSNRVLPHYEQQNNVIVKTASNGTAVLSKTYGDPTNTGTELFRALALSSDMLYLYAGATQGGKLRRGGWVGGVWRGGSKGGAYSIQSFCGVPNDRSARLMNPRLTTSCAQGRPRTTPIPRPPSTER